MTGILVVLGAEWSDVISLLVMLLLLFAEVTPKTIAVFDPVKIIASVIALPLSILVKFITP